MSPDTASLLARFDALDTPAVSDALDRLGLSGTCQGIRALIPGVKAVGRAFTVSYVPAGDPAGTVGDFIDDVGPDEVVVLDNRGRADCTVWGDLLTFVAVSRGIAGTFIDGVCRDAPGIAEAGYALFSRGCFMRTGKDRVEVAGVNVPVALAGVQVRPGDLVFGDDSGVVVIPVGRADEVVAIAEEVSERERTIVELVNSGLTLRDARKRVNYHTLQRGS